MPRRCKSNFRSWHLLMGLNHNAGLNSFPPFPTWKRCVLLELLYVYAPNCFHLMLFSDFLLELGLC